MSRHETNYGASQEGVDPGSIQVFFLSPADFVRRMSHPVIHDGECKTGVVVRARAIEDGSVARGIAPGFL